MITPVIIEIKPTKTLVGGVGLFAVEELEQGAIIATTDQYIADFYSWDNISQVSEVTEKKIIDFCLTTKEGFYCPKNLNYLSIVWYMNHSCEPNVVFAENGDFVTKTSVKKNEELCWDYGYGVTDPNFRFDCLCGKPACRKIISGIDYKNPEFRLKFGKYFLPNLR